MFRSFGDNKIQKIMVLYELRFWKKDKSANIHLAVGDFGKDTIGFRKSSSSLLSYFVGEERKHNEGSGRFLDQVRLDMCRRRGLLRSAKTMYILRKADLKRHAAKCRDF
jgi:hypothetical protein